MRPNLILVIYSMYQQKCTPHVRSVTRKLILKHLDTLDKVEKSRGDDVHGISKCVYFLSDVFLTNI